MMMEYSALPNEASHFLFSMLDKYIQCFKNDFHSFFILLLPISICELASIYIQII